MKCELTFRSGRTRPTRAKSSGLERLLRIRSLAGCTTDTHESRFRKRQGEHHSLGRTYRRRPNRITRRPQATALTDVTQWQGAKVGSHLEGLDRDLKRHRSLIPMKLSLLIGAEHRPLTRWHSVLPSTWNKSASRGSLGSTVSQLETTCLMARRRGSRHSRRACDSLPSRARADPYSSFAAPQPNSAVHKPRDLVPLLKAWGAMQHLSPTDQRFRRVLAHARSDSASGSV